MVLFVNEDLIRTQFDMCETLAPGVTKLILVSPLPADEQLALFHTLEEALHNSLEHPWYLRKPGVNFNPLPARLIEILLREAEISDTSLMKEALGYVGELFPRLVSVDAPALAYGLDTTRHLHRASLCRKELQTITENLNHALSILPKQLAESRLATLFTAALERWNKRTLPNE